MDAIIYGAKSTDDRKGSFPDQLSRPLESEPRSAG